MRHASRLFGLFALALMFFPLHAAESRSSEQGFVATLQLGPSPDVHYLDAAGKPLSYAAFAQQLG